MAAQKQALPPEEESKVRGEYQKVAEREVRASFLLEEIGRQEAIEVTEEEVTDQLAEMARAYQRPAEELRDNVPLLDAIRRGLRREKTVDFLIAEAKITETE
jgi:trigger factor